jgi:hypothetical protein
MSGVKRMMEQHEDMCRSAVGIAIEAGVLKRCEYHEECVFEGPEDIVSAYKLGNYKLKLDEALKEMFDAPRKLTDCIKEVVADHSASECPRCAKFRDE